jgi:hypothetical protein
MAMGRFGRLNMTSWGRWSSAKNAGSCEVTPRRDARMTDKFERTKSPPVAILIIIASLILVAGWTAYWFVNPFRAPNRLEILDRTKLADGSELLLAQSYNGSLGEPSSIMAYQQVQSNLWISYYIDHEASYWRSGNLAPTNIKRTRFAVLRGNESIAEIDCLEHTSTSAWNKQLMSMASLLDQSPLARPNRRPQSIGQFQN